MNKSETQNLANELNLTAPNNARDLEFDFAMCHSCYSYCNFRCKCPE